MGLLFPFQPAAGDYPNHLAQPRPERSRLAAARWLPVLLVLACLAPRLAMALRIPSVCPDGVLYIHAAKALEAGDLSAGLREMSLNPYPVVLMLLHRMGLEWLPAATCWGVVAAGLTVLPLWGWTRRQFDDRVALAACLLYALHPTFIQWSAEAIRDQTFWLLFMLAIYWLWRAEVELRLGLFVAAGGAAALAALTRIEGLLLAVPLVEWTFWRRRALTVKRERGMLLLGALLCVAAVPLLGLLIDAVWLDGRLGWKLLRFAPLQRVQSFVEYIVPGGDDGGVAAPLGLKEMVWEFFPAMTRGLSPIFALLMFGGIWGWRRQWLRRDHQPLFHVALAVMLGIWIHLWFTHSADPRYALPIALMAAPWAGLGLLWLIDRLARLWRWSGLGRCRPTLVAAIVWAAVTAICVSDALTSKSGYFAQRRTAVAVGHWLREQFPPSAVLVGPQGLTAIVSFHAHDGPYVEFRCEAANNIIVNKALERHADVVLLKAARALGVPRCRKIIALLQPLGYCPAAPRRMPPVEADFFILVRAERGDLTNPVPP